MGSSHLVNGMPDEFIWQWMVAMKLLPVCALAIYLLFFDIVNSN